MPDRLPSRLRLPGNRSTETRPSDRAGSAPDPVRELRFAQGWLPARRARGQRDPSRLGHGAARSFARNGLRRHARVCGLSRGPRWIGVPAPTAEPEAITDEGSAAQLRGRAARPASASILARRQTRGRVVHRSNCLSAPSSAPSLVDHASLSAVRVSVLAGVLPSAITSWVFALAYSREPRIRRVVPRRMVVCRP